LAGGGGNDLLSGGGGNDTVTGDAGNDTFMAGVGDGNDAYNGGAGIDTLDLHLTAAGATVTTNSASSAEIGLDTLTGIENVIGSQGADTISLNGNANVIDGQGGDDSINAGGSNDVIVGGGGSDTMIGGGGGDSFVFGTGFGNDVIGDFDAVGAGTLATQDLLDLSALGVTSANFAAHVVITDLGNDMLVTIDGVNHITLLGVTGIGANAITQQDFLLAV
jgi:Ca2+-binding RTX toxin-like protein